MRNRDISLVTGIVVAGAALGGPVTAQAAQTPHPNQTSTKAVPAVGVNRPSALPTASASGADVVPIDWGWLDSHAPGPADQPGQQMAAILQNSSRYLATNWYDANYIGANAYAADGYLRLGGNAEQNVRLPAMAALSLATSLKLGTYNPGATGVSPADATNRAIELIRSIAHRHYANNTDAAEADWGNDWQSALWAFYDGQAAWLMWDKLSPQDQDGVARMIATEADRLTTGDNVYLTSDHTAWQLYQFDRDGNDITPGDTKAEEDNGDADVLALAVAMMPNHSHAAAWQQRNEDLLLAAAAQPADLTKTTTVNGHQLNLWLQGTNVAADGTLTNADIVHPLYMTAFDQSLQQVGTYGLAKNTCAPQAVQQNIGHVYSALTTLKTFKLTTGQTITMPNPIYQPGSAAINYPQGNNWGTEFPAYYGSFDMLVGMYGQDPATSGQTTAEQWSAIHNQAEIGLQNRPAVGGTGQTYIPNSGENTYVGAEQRVGQISAQAYLADWLNLRQKACFTNTGPWTSPGGGRQQAAVTRIAGADRVGTGIAVSQKQWSAIGGDPTPQQPARQQAQAVVLARDDLFPDALAGVPLSNRVRGPLLLTEPTALNWASEAEIKRILPAHAGMTVFVLGGNSAISPAIVNKLTADGYNVVRYAGADRDGTALDIATQGMGSPKQVIVATGQDFPDALAGGPLAAAEGDAILLSDGPVLGAATKDYLATARTAPSFHMYAVGGAAVKATSYLGGQQHILSGADRFATAVAVAQRFAADMPVTRFGLATGTSFADALTGGAFMAEEGQPLLLTNSNALPGQDAVLLSGMQSQISAVTLFGGPVAVNQPVMDTVAGLVNGREG